MFFFFCFLLSPISPRLLFIHFTHHVPLMCVSVQYVAELLHEQSQPIVSTCSAADVQAAFNTIVTRIQRLWVPSCIHTQRTIKKSSSLSWSRPRQTLYVYRGSPPENSRMLLLTLPQCSLSVNPFYQKKVPVFPLKCWSSAFLLSLLDPSARLLSPQEVMSVGDQAASVCFAASLKPVFSLIQLNCKFSTVYTSAPQSTCLLQLGPCHVHPYTCLTLTWSLSVVTASADVVTESKQSHQTCRCCQIA